MLNRPRLLSFIAALSSLLLVLGLAVPAAAVEDKASEAPEASKRLFRVERPDRAVRGRAVFSVFHGPASVTLTDASSDGHQLGDLRVTSIPTTTKDGTPLGRLDATLTTTAIDIPEAGDEIRISSLVFAFGKDGQSQIVVGGTAVYPAEGPTIAVDAVTTRPILGGSGRFAGASGTAQTKHLADDTWVHTFALGRQAANARISIRRVAPDRARGLPVRLREGMRRFQAERRELVGHADGDDRSDRKSSRERKPRQPKVEAFPELKAAEEAAKAAFAEAKAAYKAAYKAANKEAREAARAAKKAEKEARRKGDDQIETVDVSDTADEAPAEVGITRIDLGVASPATAPGEQLGLWQYAIPAGSELVPHTHAGWQIARIARGELEYTVLEGEGSIIHADGSSTTIGPGVHILATGDSVVENPDLVHQGANRTDDEVIIIAATLYGEGEPLAIPVEEPPVEEPAA